MTTYTSFVDGTNLTDSATTYYTVTSRTTAIIKAATFCNDASYPVTVTINIVPSGGTVGYANRLIKTKTIGAGETWSCPDLINHNIQASGFISMLASVTGVIGCRISGIEIV